MEIDIDDFVIPVDTITEDTFKAKRGLFRRKKEALFSATVYLRRVSSLEGNSSFEGKFYLSNKGSFLIFTKKDEFSLIPLDNIAYIRFTPKLNDDVN